MTDRRSFCDILKNSRPGDPVRRGLLGAPASPARASAVSFVAHKGALVARVGVVSCGHITFLAPGLRAECQWLCLLPGTPIRPQLAANVEKAMGALTFLIEQWFEAAGHVMSASAQLKLQRQAQRDADLADPLGR